MPVWRYVTVGLRNLLVTFFAIACTSCVSFDDAIDRVLADFSEATEPAQDGRKLAVFSVFVPKSDKNKVISVSVTDGREIPIGPISIEELVETPLVEFRYSELPNDPPVGDIYRNRSTYQAYAEALSTTISEVFGRQLRITIEFVVVPPDIKLREKYESRADGEKFGVRFFHPEEDSAWISKYRTDLKAISHEVFHAYDELTRWSVNRAGEGTLLEDALGEASASLFAKCVELRSSGRATVYRDPIPTEDGRTVRFTDAYLLDVLNNVDEKNGLTRAQQRIIGDILAWAIWLEYAGPRWEVQRGEPASKKLQGLCTNGILADHDGLAALLRAIASDGEDGPVLSLDT